MWIEYGFTSLASARAFADDRKDKDTRAHWWWGCVENYDGTSYTLSDYLEELCEDWFDGQVVVLYDVDED